MTVNSRGSGSDERSAALSYGKPKKHTTYFVWQRRKGADEWGSPYTPSSDKGLAEHARKHRLEIRVERVTKTTSEAIIRG